MSEITIDHQKYDGTGTFTAAREGKEIGMMSYNIVRGNVMNIYHTEVDEDAEGQGIGTQLVKRGITYARENNLKIDPACEFAKSFFKKNKDFADVLA